MAKLKSAPPPFVERLELALTDKLHESGIRAEVRTERVPTTRLYRVAVYASQFKEMNHSERQDLVWRIAEHALSSDELFHISMILTLAPDEAEGR